MDSNTKIGNVTQFILVTFDSAQNVHETTLNKNLTANPDATYAEVDTAMKALATLSSDSYSNTYLITKIDVNEVLAG